jgi:hypothetical protein
MNWVQSTLTSQIYSKEMNNHTMHFGTTQLINRRLKGGAQLLVKLRGTRAFLENFAYSDFPKLSLTSSIETLGICWNDFNKAIPTNINPDNSTWGYILVVVPERLETMYLQLLTHVRWNM